MVRRLGEGLSRLVNRILYAATVSDAQHTQGAEQAHRFVGDFIAYLAAIGPDYAALSANRRQRDLMDLLVESELQDKIYRVAHEKGVGHDVLGLGYHAGWRHLEPVRFVGYTSQLTVKWNVSHSRPVDIRLTGSFVKNGVGHMHFYFFPEKISHESGTLRGTSGSWDFTIQQDGNWLSCKTRVGDEEVERMYHYIGAFEDSTGTQRHMYLCNDYNDINRRYLGTERAPALLGLLGLQPSPT